MIKTFIVGSGVVLGLALAATVALAWGPGFGSWFGRCNGQTKRNGGSSIGAPAESHNSG